MQGRGSSKASMDIETYVPSRMVTRILLPALSLVPSNPGLVFEVWGAVRELPFATRHAFYESWRGQGLEQAAIGHKHYEVVRAECRAGFEVRRILKRVANEKRSSKYVGRQLAKIAHCNPLVVFDISLSQIESYDNMIFPLIESLGYMTPLAFDVLSYMLTLRLGATARPKLQPDGINVARWFQHLAHFAGAMYRSHPHAEIGSLFQFLLARSVCVLTAFD